MRLRYRLGPAAITLVLLAGCTSSPTGGTTAATAGTALTVAVGDEPRSLHPLLGFGAGTVSRIFDGLLQRSADGTLKPALAVEAPSPSADGKSWTAKVRTGVSFQDGTAFNAEDVAATYQALLDPRFASPLRDSYLMITKVTAPDNETVRFELAFPYAPLPNLLTLGIVPKASLATPGPLAASPFATKPVGTGPYKLTDWKPHDKLVLTANDRYFGDKPKVNTMTVLFVPDDEVRARRMKAGEFDGATLAPWQVSGFDKLSGYRLVSYRSADLRMITLPSKNPVTGDQSMRVALNRAVNRKAMVDGPLAGKGSVATTLIPDIMPEFIEPGARFSLDLGEADTRLDQAGWIKGTDGFRARNGVPARFTVLYPEGDPLRRDLVRAFADDAKKIGVDVRAEAQSWDAIAARAGADAVLLSAGDPVDPDLDAYPLAHSIDGGGWIIAGDRPDSFVRNPGRYSNTPVDQALDAGRTTADPAQRAAFYRQFQRAWQADPGAVPLVTVEHGYVIKDKWSGYPQQAIEAAGQGVTSGPWWGIS